MALITIRNIKVSFGDPPLLCNVNLRIEPKERVCLVGRNGCGKTTLLKLLLKQIDADSGEIDLGDGVKVSGLSQDIPTDVSGTCFEVISKALDLQFVSPEEQKYKVETVISQLGLDSDLPFNAMSGGLKRRVLLAKALLIEPDLLLLDEPTNHLDIDSIDWLEQFLLRYKGALLFITHDRFFLQKLATRIIDLDRGKLTSWPGDYATYISKKQASIEIEDKENTKFDRKIAQEEVWIRKGIKARRTRNEGRARDLFKMRELAKQRRTNSGSVKISMQEAGRTSKQIVKAKNVNFAYNDDANKLVINDLNLSVYRGDKIGIIGPNGCGKTTLIKLILGELTATSGSLTPGANVQVAYLDQLRGQLDDQKTVIDNVIDAGDNVIINGKPKHIISYLQDFLFSPQRAKTPVWVLSGGERNRLLLAKLFTKPSNVLVLDEPTNDLDTETLELLEERVIEYNGTVLLVSHDRAFLNNTVTSTLVFEKNNKISEYVGGYNDWLKQRSDSTEKVKTSTKSKKRKPKSVAPRKLTFKENFELEKLPEKIEMHEKEQATLHNKMSNSDFFKHSGDKVSAVTKRLEELEKSLIENYARWEELEKIREQNPKS